MTLQNKVETETNLNSKGSLPVSGPDSFYALEKVEQESWLGVAKGLGLDKEEWILFLQGLGRLPSLEETAVAGALWSEHCSYKSSRVHLKRFHVEAPWVWQGPGENAGIVGINDNFGIAFKMESHNHPSYIEPYQGAATGVGGILRDIFCMGALPIANLNCLRFGEGEWNAHLVRRTVQGIADYGNSVGVPTITGDTSFHYLYSKNILVNAFNAGLIHKDKIFRGVLSETETDFSKVTNSLATSTNFDKGKFPEFQLGEKVIGETKTWLYPAEANLLLYFGSATGRDGVHGATMSSSEFSHDGETLKPTVQVGDPFAEKVVMEATFALIEKQLVLGLQDMGAAGLTSSSVEMAGRSGCGVVIDLNLVPQRAQNMAAFEILLSESQERMLAAVRPKDLESVVQVLSCYDMPYGVIGQVNASGKFTCVFDDKIVTHIPIDLLVDKVPKYTWPLESREDYRDTNKTIVNEAKLPQTDSNVDAIACVSLEMKRPELLQALSSGITLGLFLEKYAADVVTVLGHSSLSSRSSITRHYCATVQGNTVRAGGSFAAASAGVVRLPEYAQPSTNSEQGVAIAAGCEERWVEMDPYLGSVYSTLKVLRKIAGVGGKPLGLTDCLNFGSPRSPRVMRQISDSVDGINLVAKTMSVPIVSGNVSLNNQTSGRPIPPTPMVGVVGSVENVTKVPSTHYFSRAPRGIFDPRLPSKSLTLNLFWINFKEYKAYMSFSIGILSWIWAGKNTWDLPEANLSGEQELWDTIKRGVDLHSPLEPLLVRPVGHGGLLLTALQMSFESQLALSFTSEFLDFRASLTMAEGQAGILMAVDSDQKTPTWEKLVRDGGCECVKVGSLSRAQGNEDAWMQSANKSWATSFGVYFR